MGTRNCIYRDSINKKGWRFYGECEKANDSAGTMPACDSGCGVVLRRSSEEIVFE
jgi:hypothetical protein